jgi:hypothetical protein
VEERIVWSGNADIRGRRIISVDCRLSWVSPVPIMLERIQ